MTGLTALQCLAIGSVGGALGTLVYAVGSAPQRPPERLGLRGYKRMQALHASEGFSFIEPVMRFISQRLYGLMSPLLRSKLDRQITLAGDVAGLQPEDVLALTLIAGVFGAGVGAAYGATGGNPILFALVLAVSAMAYPYLYLSSVASKRLRSIAFNTPQMIDLLALCLGAGLDFPSAVRQVVDRAVHSAAPLYEELRLVLQDLELGGTRRHALEQMAQRAPCEPVRDLVAAVVQSEEQGTPLADVLRVQAATSRMHRSTRAEEAAAKAATKLLVPLVLLFACVLILIAGPMVLQFGDVFS